MTRALLVGLLFTVGALSRADAQTSATAELRDSAGEAWGDALLIDMAKGLLVHAELRTVPPGEHGFHLHAIGLCEAPTFASAGGHFNPTGVPHGLLTPDGGHAGDLPNTFVPASGAVTLELIVPGVSLSEILDADGTALVLHEQADDYRTDPSGNAGKRLACGVVEVSGDP